MTDTASPIAATTPAQSLIRAAYPFTAIAFVSAVALFSPLARTGEWGTVLLVLYAVGSVLAIAAALVACLVRGSDRVIYSALGVIAANILLMLSLAVKSFTFGA